MVLVFSAWAMCTDGVLISAAECTLYPFRLPRTMSAVWYKLSKIYTTGGDVAGPSQSTRSN